MYKKLFSKHLKKSILLVTVLAVSLGLALIPGDSLALVDSSEPYLVKDINLGSEGSIDDMRKENVNGMLFFEANNGVHGRELWKSNGTEAGTMLVKDINTVNEWTDLGNFTDVNGTLFFGADDGVHGKELWKSDGIEAGTVLVKDIIPGIESANPWSLTSLNGTLLFSADDGVHGRELWKSNGSESGTVIVKDIKPDSEGSYPGELTHMNGTLFFTADDGTHGEELWKSDGTEAGTVLVKDIIPGIVGSNPDNFTNVNGTLFFTASDEIHDELWKSDGTEVGTVIVKDIFPGSEGGSGPSELTNVNGTLFFVIHTQALGNQLWKSDGTEVGTEMVKNWINEDYLRFDSLTAVNNLLFFSFFDGDRELYKSDGTEAGTVMVKDINPYGSSYPEEFASINGMLYFRAYDGTHGVEMWRSDSTEAGTLLVKDINTGPGDSNPENIIKVNGTIFFEADDGIHGKELWRLDVPDIFFLTSITPNVAVANTGDLPVTISGFNLSSPVSAHIGGVPLLNPNLVSDTTLNAVVPVNSLEMGVYDLTVMVGGETDTLEEAFIVGTTGPWYVATSGNDGDDCLSPTTPCATINGTLNKPGFLADSSILVATGIYTGTGEVVVRLDKSVTISGGWTSNFTTKSGISTIDGEESRRGVNVAEGGVEANIENFAIQNGYHIEGGGISCEGTLTLTNSIVNNNTADEHAGGILVGDGCMLSLESSIVSGNLTNGRGGGIVVDGGRLIEMSRTWLVGNAADAEGGGIVFMGSPRSSVYVENSIVAGNTSTYGGGFWLNLDGPYQIVNSNIVGNYASGGGAAIYSFNGPKIDITNTLILSNTGSTGLTGGPMSLYYCDTYGNSPDIGITRNNCLGSPPEDGLDPMMAGGTLPSGVGPDYAAEWLSYDYRLLPGSPAIDAGTLVDALTTDIDGNPRDATPDLGAYEMGNSPPSISGTQAGQTVDDNATIDPFAGVTIADPDDDTLNVFISLNNANKGVLTNLGGFVKGPSGTYTFLGSPSSATTAIQGLTFDPTENRKTPGSTDTTIFTISANDGTADPVTDDTTTVIATSINDLPTITGTVAGQTVDDNDNIAPFTGVTIADPDKNATLTVTVSLDDPDKGVLTNLGGFVEGPAGTYTFECSPSEATTAIQGLVFYPTVGRVPVGQSETTTFTISADDSFAAPVTDVTTTVIVTAVGAENTPPSISGTVAGQTMDDNATIDPFTTVTISDPDTATITVTVSLDNSAKGAMINLGGFVEGPTGTYTFTGSPAEATTAIRALTFDPTEDRVPVGQDETTTFTISVDDGIADPVTDDTTTVIITAVGTTIKLFLPIITR